MKNILTLLVLVLSLSADAQVAFFRPPPDTSAATPTNSIWTGLIAYYRCDEASGALVDASPLTHDFVANNAPGSDTGQITNSRTFTAASLMYFSSTNNTDFNVTTKATWKFWSYKTDTTANARPAFTKFNSGVATEYFISTSSSLAGDGPFVAIAPTTTDTFLAFGWCASAYTVNTWYHTVVVYDGTQAGNSTRLVIYVNGVQKTLTFTGTIPSSISATTAAIQIGGNTGSSLYMGGRLDEIAYLKGVTWTATQATNNYTAELAGTSYPY